jgi:pimeloyl-ACP methyl ester carboxylesterase
VAEGQASLAPPSPATVNFAAADIADLRSRLSDTRMPHFPFSDPWSFGTGGKIAAELVDRWAERLDESVLTSKFSGLPQVRIELADTWIHVVHIRGEIDDALPIVLTHGWPSTVLELLPLARRLARPSDHGGDANDAFHVVIPALPGFPLSGAPPDLGEYTGARIAERWAQIMDRLGYARFVASGGDVGARVAGWLGACHAHRVLGIHVSSNALWPLLADTELGTDEAAWVEHRSDWTRTEGGYMHIQQTKPLSLAYGLAQSPIALAAWIGEKWRGWSGTDEVFEQLTSELLDTLTLYWLSNRIATSFLPYYVYDRPPGARPWGQDVKVPVSFYLCPNEIGGVPPRSFAERQYRIARWSEFPAGGHFMALEQPGALAADIRAAFRTQRRAREPGCT